MILYQSMRVTAPTLDWDFSHWLNKSTKILIFDWMGQLSSQSMIRKSTRQRVPNWGKQNFKMCQTRTKSSRSINLHILNICLADPITKICCTGWKGIVGITALYQAFGNAEQNNHKLCTCIQRSWAVQSYVLAVQNLDNYLIRTVCQLPTI